MFYSTTDGQYIREGQAFTIGDVQYPQNWLNHSTPEEKEAIGLEEVVATNSPKHDKYYWVSSTLDGAELTYTNTPKDLDNVKSLAISEINQIAHSILLPSDWMVVKSVETSTSMPEAWGTWRSSVRATANTAKTAISEATDVDEVQEIMSNITWSLDPNQPTE